MCPFYSGVKVFAANTLTYIPRTRKYHDFLIARSHDQSLVIKVRESCCSGSFSQSPLRILAPDMVGIPTENYKETQFRNLSAEKLENMKLMYNQFIPLHRRPDYLPPFTPSVAASTRRHASDPCSSSSLALPPAKRPRKKSSC